MKILAVHDGHNASAMLYIDDALVIAYQEERFSRVKNQYGFPFLAVQYIFNQLSLTWSDIDKLIFTSRYLPRAPDFESSGDPRRYRPSIWQAMINLIGCVSFVRSAKSAVSQFSRSRALSKVFSGDIHFLDHHTCHARSALRFWSPAPSSDALVFTLDGGGDFAGCTSATINRDGVISNRALASDHLSVGGLWAMVTALLGFKPLEHEYKLMGMAPYSTASRGALYEYFRGLFIVRDGVIRARGNLFSQIMFPWRLKERLAFERFDTIMGSLQCATEDIVMHWIETVVEDNPRIKALAFSGGVFMNVKLNGLISQKFHDFELCYVPSCGDESLPFGVDAGDPSRGDREMFRRVPSLRLGRRLEHLSTQVYSGTSLSSTCSLREASVGDVVDLLVAGEIIGLVDGREEFGARALGARSILAATGDWKVVDRINSVIKHRDFWMPFACAVAKPFVSEYFVTTKSDFPYMMVTAPTRSEYLMKLAGAIHPTDGTCRIQSVEELDGCLHTIIRDYGQRTGIHALLNTSLNVHGSPLVSSWEDVVDVFSRTELRYVYIAEEGLLIKKEVFN